MADDSNTISIDVWPFSKHADRVGVVLNVDVAESQISCAQKRLSSSARSTIVILGNQVSSFAFSSWATYIVRTDFARARTAVVR